MKQKKHLLPYIFFALLIVLATIAAMQFFHSKKEKNSFLLKHYFPSDDTNSAFYGPRIAQEFDKRVFIDYKIDGGQTDKTVFTKIDQTINQFDSPQPKNVIKVHMNDNCSYGEIISLINLAHVHRINKYLLLENSFYYVVEKR